MWQPTRPDEEGKHSQLGALARPIAWTDWLTSSWKVCRWCRRHMTTLIDAQCHVVAMICERCDLAA